MMGCLLVKLFILNLFVSPTAGVSGTTSTAIQGRVVDLRGYKMAGLEITAIGRTGGTSYQATSDEDGHFVFQQVAPDVYTLTTQCAGIERVISSVEAKAGASAEVEMVAVAQQPTGNPEIDKHISSSFGQGGSYPAGNISYLNLNDSIDYYFMIIYF